jgi:acid stress-induced BolA-like protein IbaG/YrbA
MERLKSALEKWLPQDLPGMQVEIDPLRRGFKISGIVVWQSFEGLEPIDRQQILWEKLRARLSREDQLRIAILITFTPAEYAVHREPQLV